MSTIEPVPGDVLFRWIKIVILIVVCVMAFQQVAMNLVLLYGLFRPEVDNEKILAILAPGYQTTIGQFGSIIGAIGGYLVGRQK